MGEMVGRRHTLEYSPGLGNPDQRGGGTCIPLPSLQSPWSPLLSSLPPHPTPSPMTGKGGEI